MARTTAVAVKATCVAVCGLGTVGKGVLKQIAKQTGYKVTKVLVRDKENVKREQLELLNRDVTEICDKVEDITQDPIIDIVVETIGGLSETAYAIEIGALKNNKRVVTANKTLIAEHAIEFQKYLDNNMLFCDACVCGGLPLISLLRDNFGDRVESVEGIINGTTNYILTKMQNDPSILSYEDVLKSGRDAGFAEEDSSYDVNGVDARDKLIVLGAAYFEQFVMTSEIYYVGITKIQQEDFEVAKSLYCKIKLFAKIYYNSFEDGNRLKAFVIPAFVANTNILSMVDFEQNCAIIKSKYRDNTVVMGPGAGEGPTAASVISDIMRANQSAARQALAELATVTKPKEEYCYGNTKRIAKREPGKFYETTTFEFIIRTKYSLKEFIDIYGKNEEPEKWKEIQHEKTDGNFHYLAVQGVEINAFSGSGLVFLLV